MGGRIVKMLWAMVLMGITAQCVAAEESEIDVWATLLRPQYFGARDIVPGKDLIELRIPPRADDAGVVPISVNAKIPQTAARYISS